MPDKGVSRRGFLSGIGAGAAGAAGAVALGPSEAVAQFVHPTIETRSDRFSRIFDDLPPFAEATDPVREGLRALGAPGGIMDAQDPLAEGPIRLITNPELSPANVDNPAHTAGVTFFGQFLDHDMTFDLTSPLGVPTRPERSQNSRTPGLDLDSVYGRGPFEDPQLYSRDRTRLRVEHGGRFEDLPRTSEGTAIIADPRNDENLMIAGLQVAMLKFHNNVVDRLRSAGVSRDVFDKARQLVRWHYQWIILHEFLPSIVGTPLVNEILSRGRQFYRARPGEQSIPVEFQGATYRFGHSLVRPSYRANLLGDINPNTGAQAPFFGFIFDPAGEGQDDPVDLRGGARAPRRFMGWQTFFNFGGDQAANVRPNKRLDTHISTPLFNLPLGTIASGDPPTALPQRNLLRHLTWGIPSGQAIARRMRIQPLSSSQLSDLAQFGIGLERNTPLWFYVLREADLLADGQRLAGVGARIVAEVFIGLLQLDPRSYLFQEPRWRPTLPSRVRGTFGIVDLLTFAEVDPASRGQ